MSWITDRWMDNPYGPDEKCEKCGHYYDYCDCPCCNEPDEPVKEETRPHES